MSATQNHTYSYGRTSAYQVQFILPDKKNFDASLQMVKDVFHNVSSDINKGKDIKTELKHIGNCEVMGDPSMIVKIALKVGKDTYLVKHFELLKAAVEKHPSYEGINLTWMAVSPADGDRKPGQDNALTHAQFKAIDRPAEAIGVGFNTAPVTSMGRATQASTKASATMGPPPITWNGYIIPVKLMADTGLVGGGRMLSLTQSDQELRLSMEKTLQLEIQDVKRLTVVHGWYEVSYVRSFAVFVQVYDKVSEIRKDRLVEEVRRALVEPIGWRFHISDDRRNVISTGELNRVGTLIWFVLTQVHIFPCMYYRSELQDVANNARSHSTKSSIDRNTSSD